MTVTPPEPPLRADARRNYERLVEAAREVFAEQGAGAPLDDIARRAGVGNATLYRRFPTRQALLEAVHRDRIEALCARAGELLAAPSAGAGLTTWLRELVAHGSVSRPLASTLMGALRDEGSEESWCRGALHRAAADLLDRARRAREIRPDITVTQMLKLANAVVLAAEDDSAEPGQADRLLSLVMDGLRHRSSGLATGPVRYALMLCADESTDVSGAPAGETGARDAEAEQVRASDAEGQGGGLMAGCDRWSAEMERRGILRGTLGLRPPDESTTVRVRGGKVLLTDGPFTETKEQIGGFSLVECADLDEAIEVAAEHPWAEIGMLQVRPVWER